MKNYFPRTLHQKLPFDLAGHITLLLKIPKTDEKIAVTSTMHFSYQNAIKVRWVNRQKNFPISFEDTANFSFLNFYLRGTKISLILSKKNEWASKNRAYFYKMKYILTPSIKFKQKFTRLSSTGWNRFNFKSKFEFLAPCQLVFKQISCNFLWGSISGCT